MENGKIIDKSVLLLYVSFSCRFADVQVFVPSLRCCCVLLFSSLRQFTHFAYKNESSNLHKETTKSG